jgi:hypothetical protein
MGHVTCLGDRIEDALETARDIKVALRIPAADAL